MRPRQQMPFNPNSFRQQPFQQMRGMRGPGPSGFGMMGPGGMQGNIPRSAGQKSGGLLAKFLNRGVPPKQQPASSILFKALQDFNVPRQLQEVHS
ncbi:hypothetical protein [Bacillus sp. P14.5]|uniref:hypothetical protein n=1 Tax=Bacillus sp. P14.5 TaxID=1983400 RepID=UPI001F06F502|nr:hypothetical protein [Bacillus sp. P14.5]